MPKQILMPVIAGMTTLALAGCNTSGSGQTSPASASSSQDFAIQSVSISSLTTANLCRQLGGNGAPPTVTIKHTPKAGVRLRLRMYDTVSNGVTVEHKRTTVRSSASGTTTVTHRFLPPCNRSGNTSSTYRLDVSANDSSKTGRWGRYNSRSRSIF